MSSQELLRLQVYAAIVLIGMSFLDGLCAGMGAAVMPAGFNADHGKGGRSEQKADEIVDDVEGFVLLALLAYTRLALHGNRLRCCRE